MASAVGGTDLGALGFGCRKVHCARESLPGHRTTHDILLLRAEGPKAYAARTAAGQAQQKQRKQNTTKQKQH